MKKIILLLITFQLGLCFTSCVTKEKIRIDGSSTVYPLTEAVTESFLTQNKKTNIVIGISGTGGGFKKFCNEEIDIQNASREIKNIEIKNCKLKNVTYTVHPVAYDGIAVVTNTKNKFVNYLTVEELKKIFQNKDQAQTWKDIRKEWPDNKFKIFTPSQDNGTYDYFVEAILRENAKIRSDTIFSTNPNVLVTGIMGETNSIGFFSVAYYTANKETLHIIPIVNPNTKSKVLPTLQTVINQSYKPLSRKLFLYVNNRMQKEKPILSKFVDFYLSHANELTTKIGYFPYKKE